MAISHGVPQSALGHREGQSSAGAPYQLPEDTHHHLDCRLEASMAMNEQPVGHGGQTLTSQHGCGIHQRRRTPELTKTQGI